MEVAAEAGAHTQQPWGQFKEEVEIMEEEHGGGGADEVEEPLNRKIRKRPDLAHDHGSSNGNGNGNGNGAHHANGGGEEDHARVGGEGEAVEEQQQHKSIFFDPAKGLWKCRHCDWTYRLASPCGNGILDHRGYHHQIPKSLVQKEPSYGSMNRGMMRSSAEKGDTNRTWTPKGKGLEAHENGNAQEINHGPGNGKLDNGSHSNGSHQAPNGAKPKIEYMFEINKTEIYPSEVNKDGQVAEAQAKVEEYDLEKILDEQETYELQCPMCQSCITRRVILKKRKRSVPTSPTGEPLKRPDFKGAVPPVTSPGRVEGAPPDVFRCLSCFSFFIPTGCSFNIFRIFGRRDVGGQHIPVLPPPALEDTLPHSENCTSWLLSCFQTGDSPNQPAPPDSDNKGAPDLPRIPPSPGTTTKTTETNESYVTKQSTVDSCSQDQTTTTFTSETITTSSINTTEAPSASFQTSSSTEYFKQDVTTVVPGKMPFGGAIMDPIHPPIGYKDARGTAENGSFPGHAIQTPDLKQVDSPIVTNIVPELPDVVISVLEDVNPTPPRPQQRDDWDILKAIVYGGLVESVTSLSIVSAAASSGAKTLDIFILGIANLIGGLPLIFHNIADLRDIRDVDGNNEQIGHYWLQLGRRSKARLHMVMALLSYMVFGLLPPVLYGLSFRESNDRENKMMVVAGASLACIALLALGKAHVHTRTYFKTLMYYLTIAVSSSGLSYVAGVLIARLLVHYGIIEQGGSSAPATPGLSSPFAYGAGAGSSAWASF
ncbi:hypothetical protein ZWY2020_047687 [Hordeum vulgare]|nr:hypothetical protein ZWY2020_047687 [Hordeum vulgare]